MKENDSDWSNIIDLLLVAPKDEMDDSVKELITKWSNPPQPIQVLEVLDKCVHASLSTSFVVKILQMLYDTSCLENNISHEEVVKNASWRNPNNLN